jgi:glutaredoxin 3
VAHREPAADPRLTRSLFTTNARLLRPRYGDHESDRLASEERRMSEPKVVMYLTGWCSYCTRARQLLKDKGVDFEQIDVDACPEARAQMTARSGRHTVPQIFIGATHVGGCDDLHALEASGRLDSLLKTGV